MKKILIIFLLIMIIICFYQISSMYALYKTTLEGNLTTDLGVWSIKVNGTDISSGEQNLSLELTDENFKIVADNNVVDDKIAPGTKMYADLVIDPSNTDVSIIYTININTDFENNITLSKVENFFEKSDNVEQINNEQFTFEEGVLTGIIPLTKINEGYNNKIRIYFIWKNSEENNEKDSSIGSQENSQLLIPIEVNLKQYMGESY